ncbi:MAG TPA: FHA domain-containing protein [Solirubrobacteraceae bacterium]|nr:FHA domain-containing protein [Solirubrobacteraceae bacterium]
MAPQSIASIPSADDRDTAVRGDTTGLRPDPYAVLDHRIAARTLRPADALPGHYLSVADAGAGAHLIALEDAIIHVGRASAADIRFDDVHVSRRHAIIVRDGHRVRVLDDRSTAGTFVNGMRTVATDLTSGDVIRLGSVSVTYLRVR